MSGRKVPGRAKKLPNSKNELVQALLATIRSAELFQCDELARLKVVQQLGSEAKVTTTLGDIYFKLFPQETPKTCENFVTHARNGYYDGVVFHRVIDGFMAQTGDPTGTGTGGSELPDIAAEFHRMPHVRGTVSMARAASEDSANSQFFIVFQPNFKLDNKYTIFGRVTSGMEYVDAIQRGEPPANPDIIIQASLGDAPKPEPDYASVRARLNAAAGAVAPAPSAADLNAPIGQ